MNRLLLAGAFTLLLALAGCTKHGGEAAGGTDSAVAVLPGSASDAMIQYDTLRSQPPHAVPTGGTAGRARTGPASQAADDTLSAPEEAAPPVVDAAPPAPAT
jgi:hypothetical protein